MPIGKINRLLRLILPGAFCVFTFMVDDQMSSSIEKSSGRSSVVKEAIVNGLKVCCCRLRRHRRRVGGQFLCLFFGASLSVTGCPGFVELPWMSPSSSSASSGIVLNHTLAPRRVPCAIFESSGENHDPLFLMIPEFYAEIDDFTPP